MRHQKLSQRLNRSLGHRRMTLRNLAISLLRHQQIKTTKAKAKAAQSFTERIISLSKQDSLSCHRKAFKILQDRQAVKLLFSQITPLFKERNSGFSRILPLSARKGDGAEIVLLELTEKSQPLAETKKAKKEKTKKEEAVLEKVKAEEDKRYKPKKTKGEEKPKPEGKSEEKFKLAKGKPKPVKKIKPKKFLGGLRRLFKKERDSL